MTDTRSPEPAPDAGPAATTAAAHGRLACALCAATLALGVMLASLAAAPPAEAMSTYRWKKRPLIVFAPAAGTPALASQRSIVAGNRGGFAERDMVVVYVVGDSVTSELGGGPGQSASALRSRFGVGAGAFRAILVGKDGGAKLSSGSPLSAGTLFSTIDAMPMRRQEMRRGS